MKYPLFIVVAFALFLSACAKKLAPPPVYQESAETLADIREIPQNLEIFAKEVDASRRLIGEAQQSRLYSSFINTYFGPWEMKRTSISKREAGNVSERPHGYSSAGKAWGQAEWQALHNNANISHFPSRNSAGITLRQTDLRELPTHEARFAKPTLDPKLDPFDYFQYSSLPPGMPLLIAHTSQDGKWHYIECPVAGGWVDANDVALVNADFKSLWRRGTYAALTHDHVVLPGTGLNQTDSEAGIGAIFPILNQNKNLLRILVPIKGKNGFAGTGEVDLRLQDASKMPFPLTAGNVAKIGNSMLGQPYGWGGMLGLRDCSAMIRDLFTPFGLWLPRNSATQARRGNIIRLSGLTIQEKEAIIMREGIPFLSLVGLPGHITLYIGKWKNQPAIFHNAWGLRVIKDGNDDERFVIGKAVITTINPGQELENLYRPRAFAHRIRSLTTLGSR